jgi:RNA polymerase sigma-70 factor (ECF subfamily)
MRGDEHILELVRTAKALFFEDDRDAARDKFREAGGALVRQYRRYFVYLAWHTLPSNTKHLAEDIAQDVCLEACRSLHRFDERRAALKTWLMGIFWHCRSDAVKRYGRQRRLETDVREADSDGQRRLEDSLTEKAMLEQCIDRLQERERTILVMHVEGMTAPQIAAVAVLTSENVRQIIRRSLQTLKRCLEES